MAKRKTEKEYQIWAQLPTGKEEVTTETTYKEAKKRLNEYRENEPGPRYFLKIARVPISGSKFKVAYTLVKHDGSKVRERTETTYGTKEGAQTYADQLNEPTYFSAENARVVIV